MWYEREYIFFKNIAEQFRLPVQEIKQSSFSDFLNCKAARYFQENEKNAEYFRTMLKNCPKEKIIHIQDKEADIHILFMRLPECKEKTLLFLGPFPGKDLGMAYGIMIEFAKILWSDFCDIESCSLSMRQVHPIIEKVIEDIEANVSGDHTLRSLSKKMSVSPGHLSKLFTQEMGMTLTEYVNRKKVEYGAYLLNSTDDKICCIAIRCGVSDNNYFSRLFKRYIGISPVEYRKKGCI